MHHLPEIALVCRHFFKKKANAASARNSIGMQAFFLKKSEYSICPK